MITRLPVWVINIKASSLNKAEANIHVFDPNGDADERGQNALHFFFAKKSTVVENTVLEEVVMVEIL